MLKRLLGAMAALLLAAPLALAEVGEDGLHKADWMRDTFKDLAEDLEEANAEGKRLMLIFEQRGCIYCRQMHEEVFPKPEIASYIEENYFVVQMNLYGDVEVTDFDGDTGTEKEMARKWGIMFTPTILFFGEDLPDGQTAAQAAVAMMPGAFKAGTTLDMLTWVREKLYESDSEDAEFQRYHARKIAERAG
ncbi:thioredoxin-related protein [Aliiruegeria haliotis]|uniref:Thioredoxin-related protein n=1 Tax=Aliiruegeria haliotis TaxID=1280846 RepID=A0A2T0RYW8_9RHOB|nr:thioredoxin family protein [Aliiruegeria haliotis]PRY26340.1 thioredoxin-related protein [Aliiruegeria haliotis]